MPVAPSADVPFAHYLSTNDAPSTQELEDIWRYLSKPREALSGVNREIQELERRLASLRSRREALQETIQKYNGICSQIRALPEDILGEIFIRCLPDDRFPVFHINDAPFLLTAVCGRWRTVALQAPRLWTQFHVVTNTHNVEPPDYLSPSTNSRFGVTAERHAAILRMCIARSGTLPLHFSLRDRSSYPPNKPSPAIGFIGTLFPRLRSIYWRTWLPFEKYMASHSATSFPLLEKIMMHWVSFDTFDASNPPAYLLAPNLRDVQINGFNASPLMLPLKWGQLTRLALPGTNRVLPHAELIRLLKLCPKLEDGNFYVSGEETIECGVPSSISRADANSDTPHQLSRDLDPVSLPSLRHLDICHSECIGDLLARLRTPRLTQLALRGDRSESHMGFHVACLPMLLDHNGECLSSIEKLVIRPGVYLPPTLIECLGRLPSLRTLVLADKNGSSKYHPDTEKDHREEFDEDMLVRMTPTLPPSIEPGAVVPACLCPLLERFEFREGSNYACNRHLTLKTVVPFVAGKWEAAKTYPGQISALRHITVPSRTLPNQSVKRALRPWRKECLVVEFAHPGLDPKELPVPYDEAWKDPGPDVSYW